MSEVHRTETHSIEDDLASIALVNEVFGELIKTSEDDYVETKEEKVNTIVTSLKNSSPEAAHSIIDDIIKKERQRRFKFISKKRRSDLEYTNKIKMIELRVFVIKFLVFFTAFLLFMTFASNLYFSHKTGVEPVGFGEILKMLFNGIIDIGDD